MSGTEGMDKGRKDELAEPEVVEVEAVRGSFVDGWWGRVGESSVRMVVESDRGGGRAMRRTRRREGVDEPEGARGPENAAGNEMEAEPWPAGMETWTNSTKTKTRGT